MGWFDEQIRSRKLNDDELMDATFKDMASSLQGHRVASRMNHSKYQGSLGEILDYFHITKKDTMSDAAKDLNEELEYSLRPYGVMYRDAKLDEGWYKSAIGPMMGSMKDSGLVISLFPDVIAGYYFIHPETGKRIHITRKSAKLIEDEVICFYRPLPQKKLKVKDLFAYMFSCVSVMDIIWLLLSYAVVTALGMLTPIFTSWLFSSVLESNSVSVLVSLGVFMVTTTFATVLFTSFRTMLSSRIGVKQSSSVQAAVMMRVMSLSPRFFRQYSSGELMQRTGYVNMLCSTLTESIGVGGLTAVFSLAYVSQIGSFAPYLVVPALAIIAVTLAYSFVSAVVQMKISKKRMEQNAKEYGMSYALITGVQKIKVAGAEKRVFAKWGEKFAEGTRLTYNPPLLIKINNAISVAITLIGTLIMYYVSVKNSVSVSDYYAFSSAYAMVSGAFIATAGMALSIANIKPILDMARPILEAEPEIMGSKELVHSLHGAIELNHVSFKYEENGPLIVNDLSLKIRPGEYLAIVGSTGCGKSTLMRLMLGFEKPMKGAIYFDGKDLSSLDLTSLRRNVGAVMQNGSLMAGDIYSNIVISAPHLTLDDAWEAAEMAGMANSIREMPMGMHTLIMEGSSGISGGQRQRLLIARALAPKPKILIFDEATSALDNITQKHVSDAIDQLKCTRIVIAHRLSTIRHCSRIIVLESGQIVEDGTFDELVALNGKFAELVRRQMTDAPAN